MGRRLFQSNVNRPPLSLRRIARNLAGSGNAETIAVLVGTVTDDIRLADVPAMKICALRFTESARARTPGAEGSTVKPLARSEGRKFEKARGRRKSRGYKK